MSGSWNKTVGPKFYKGHKMETPWNNDLHHMRMVENESHYYKMIDDGSFQPLRNRNPLCLSLKEMCNDETAAAKYAIRQTNGIAPTLSARSEPKTGRKCEKTIDLLRETTGIFEKEIPALREQVANAEKRIEKLERSKFRRGRSKSAAAGSRSKRNALPWGKEYLGDTQRQMYLPSHRHGSDIDGLPSQRAQSACSQRSTGSALLDASAALTNAAKALRPQTAKTTKTILSHRLKNGWSSSLRQENVIKPFAGKGIPKRTVPCRTVDCTSGEVRVRPGRPRSAVEMNSCRRAPGYRAPDHDVIEGGADPYTGAA